jgi:hypothetical protein
MNYATSVQYKFTVVNVLEGSLCVPKCMPVVARDIVGNDGWNDCSRLTKTAFCV